MTPPSALPAAHELLIRWMFWGSITILLIYAGYNLKQAANCLNTLDRRVRRLEVGLARIVTEHQLMHRDSPGRRWSDSLADIEGLEEGGTQDG